MVFQVENNCPKHLIENQMDALEGKMDALEGKVDSLIQLVEQQIAQTGKL